MPEQPVLMALVTYGLTVVIALLVAGIISLITRAVRGRGARADKE